MKIGSITCFKKWYNLTYSEKFRETRENVIELHVSYQHTSTQKIIHAYQNMLNDQAQDDKAMIVGYYYTSTICTLYAHSLVGHAKGKRELTRQIS